MTLHLLAILGDAAFSIAWVKVTGAFLQLSLVTLLGIIENLDLIVDVELECFG